MSKLKFNKEAKKMINLVNSDCYVNYRFVIPITQVFDQLLNRLNPCEKLAYIRSVDFENRVRIAGYFYG
jgi:hypothetical protein